MTRIKAIPDEDDPLDILSEKELKALRKIKFNTLTKSALAGAMGIVVLFTPYHLFGTDLFPIRKLALPFLDEPLDVEYEYYAYSLILVFLEIWYLTYVNIKAVAKIAQACGFPEDDDHNYENNVSALISVGLERKQKNLQAIGINPYEGLSGWQVFLFQLFVRLKAALTNYLFKLLLRRLLGRYAIRALVDFAGIPVYAFWNAYASAVVMNEALVRVMAPPLIKKFTDQLYKEHSDNVEFKNLIYDSLQSVSVSKRSYHYNHFLLSITLLNRFDVQIVENPKFQTDIDVFLSMASDDTKLAFSKVVLFGIMIDGKLSQREILILKRLRNDGIMPYDTPDIKRWTKDYFNGRGLDEFLYGKTA